VNTTSTRFESVLDRARMRGYAIESIAYADWLDKLRSAALQPGTSAWVVAMLEEDQEEDQPDVDSGHGTPQLSGNTTEAALAGAGLECPPIDNPMIDRYLGFFEQTGYLNPSNRKDT
jgi:hypothetical protein